MKKRMLAAAIALSTGSVPVLADEKAMSAADIARAFGAREYIQDISLSPDGTKVALIQPDEGRGAVLTMADVKAGKPPVAILKTSGDPERLTSCQWTTSDRLICQVFYIASEAIGPVGYTRIIGINADGSGLKLLTERPSALALGSTYGGGSVIDLTGDGTSGSILMMRSFVPESSTGTHLARTRAGLGVDSVDSVSAAHRNVEPARASAVDYISDGVGNVRVMGTRSSNPDGYSRNIVSYSYRKPGSEAWTGLATMEIDGQVIHGFEPLAVDPAADVVYGFDDLDGRRALYKIALDGSTKRDLVLSRPDVDVDALIRVGRQQRVVGVSYAVDVREAEFFDPELKQLRASLGKVLPKQPLVTFTDASADEKKLLLHAGSDNDPGRYYLFDKGSRKMEELLPSRPQLGTIALATVKSITFKAADGSVIPGYLTLPAGSDGRNLPSIVMPHGGPAARDEWGFDWLSQFFAARGYAVLQPNFRGSAGYGDAWFEKNGFQSWRIAIGDINDGARWLQAQGIAAPGRLAIFGWSYGGYAALQSSVLDPDLFKAIVAVAPVTDLDTLRDESRRYTNFYIVDKFIGSGPHVEQGSPARNAAKIKAPVLLFHGNMDRNVGVAESRLMADRLRDAGKKVEYVEFKGLDHQLDDSAARAQMLEKSDAFLRASLGL